MERDALAHAGTVGERDASTDDVGIALVLVTVFTLNQLVQDAFEDLGQVL